MIRFSCASRKHHGEFIHVLLVIAIVAILLRLISGRNPV